MHGAQYPYIGLATIVYCAMCTKEMNNMNDKPTMPYILIGAGLLVCAALTVHTFPAMIEMVYELPQDVAITCGLLSILVLIMFGMFLYVLTTRR